eukprot:12364599-Alexandrium_andersonii.AAC.1
MKIEIQEPTSACSKSGRAAGIAACRNDSRLSAMRRWCGAPTVPSMPRISAPTATPSLCPRTS